MADGGDCGSASYSSGDCGGGDSGSYSIPQGIDAPRLTAEQRAQKEAQRKRYKEECALDKAHDVKRTKEIKAERHEATKLKRKIRLTISLLRVKILGAPRDD